MENNENNSLNNSSETSSSNDIIIPEMSRHSRLAKNFKKRTIKNILLTFGGILLIFFLLFKFGLDALVNFSIFVGSKGKTEQAVDIKEVGYIPSPVLNPIVSATNSADLVISGKSVKNKTVYLFINNRSKDTTTPNKEGVFKFNLELKRGSNTIKVRAGENSKYSEFSTIYTVIFNNVEPKLEIRTPTEGQSFSKDQNPISVSGITDSDVAVTVNGLWAVIDEDNNFTYDLTLEDGDNEIKIQAIDQAGNKTEKTIKVKYSR